MGVAVSELPEGVSFSSEDIPEWKAYVRRRRRLSPLLYGLTFLLIAIVILAWVEILRVAGARPPVAAIAMAVFLSLLAGIVTSAMLWFIRIPRDKTIRVGRSALEIPLRRGFAAPVTFERIPLREVASIVVVSAEGEMEGTTEIRDMLVTTRDGAAYSMGYRNPAELQRLADFLNRVLPGVLVVEKV